MNYNLFEVKKSIIIIKDREELITIDCHRSNQRLG